MSKGRLLIVPLLFAVFAGAALGGSTASRGIAVRGPGTIGDAPDPTGGPLLVNFDKPAKCALYRHGKFFTLRAVKGGRELGLHINGYFGPHLYDIDYGDPAGGVSYRDGHGFFATTYAEPAEYDSLSGWIQVNRNRTVFVRTVAFRHGTDRFVYIFGVIRCA
jgi:hypothetical protein